MFDVRFSYVLCPSLSLSSDCCPFLCKPLSPSFSLFLSHKITHTHTHESARKIWTAPKHYFKGSHKNVSLPMIHPFIDSLSGLRRAKISRIWMRHKQIQKEQFLFCKIQMISFNIQYHVGLKK